MSEETREDFLLDIKEDEDFWMFSTSQIKEILEFIED